MAKPKFDIDAAVKMIVTLSVQGSEAALSVRGNMAALIHHGAKDAILRSAEQVAHTLKDDQTRRNTALSSMRVQLGRAFDTLKMPRQSFKLVGGVAVWKAPSEAKPVDFLQKVREAILAAVGGEALTDTQASTLLAIVDGQEATSEPTIVPLPTDRPQGRRRQRTGTDG